MTKRGIFTLPLIFVLGLLYSSNVAGQTTGHATGFDGVRIEYEVASKGATTLVFVHGWMCDRSFWRKQPEHFADRFGVVLLDLGGHGSSGRNRLNWSIASFAEDVVAVMTALDLHDVVLVGHSMGGPVVAEVALHAPDRVRGVVGTDTYQYVGATWLAGDGVGNLVAPLQDDFAGTVTGWVRSMFMPSSDSTLVRSILDLMVTGSPEIGMPSARSMFEWYRDQAVGRLNQLADTIWTINSAEYVGTNVEQLQAQVPGIGVRIMDGVGHFVMLEAPEDFNSTLDEVLSRILSDPR